MHRTYTVIIERGPTSWDAYIPEYFAVADTEEEGKTLIIEAGNSHLQMLTEEGLPLTEPLDVSEQEFQLV